MTIVEFLTARLDEAEADIEGDPYDAQYRDLQFGLADIAAKRATLTTQARMTSCSGT